MKLEKGTIIAILRGVYPENASAIAKTLVGNGITRIEVSLSDEDLAIGSIQAIANDLKDTVQLGAGTVIHKHQADRAIAAGATYIITPGWDRELTRYIKSKHVEVYPGVMTTGEIMQAVQEEVEVVKLFPANVLGASYVKSLQGPFPNVQIMGVGGIEIANLKEYYDAGCSSFAIGSDLVPRGATQKDLKEIEIKAKKYLALMQELGS
ncbi:aldolase [Sporosarcina sp. BI001-red]|uniref:bifunctional 4-hydroxy-2-oxoglutarate aldolase/2-dehydro-3-deoxy-phosphogluconate aldolase n=1 Tax=Sporosarcina sp. BI001-red TaxID=2282866 RepID=UPI000E26252D|nr:bifunctional 4-hydroxy-2-oxoglutarate aldolase/2-dehydro-3-deoxy-phosphogluconate aldolase [Sporosarcina sp. BI001-red]REB08774.1 aldolase [Sporosarcina sp. BI001-red]